MIKIHDQSWIIKKNYFGQKVHFVYFLVSKFERWERNLMENRREERKLLVDYILDTKIKYLRINGSSSWEKFNGDIFYLQLAWKNRLGLIVFFSRFDYVFLDEFQGVLS